MAYRVLYVKKYTDEDKEHISYTPEHFRYKHAELDAYYVLNNIVVTRLEIEKKKFFGGWKLVAKII